MNTVQDGVSYAERLKNISDGLLEFIDVNMPEQYEQYSGEIEKSVLALLNAEKPRVMVYGIYNSGKSTLINAMMKREVAEVADRPMTSAIELFDKGEYTLVDSPGIDAPQEHEAVTNDFLNQCHIILFVISSKGGFESKYNYEKMAELISRDTPFIIVLNERGYTSDESAIREKRRQLKETRRLNEQQSLAKKQKNQRNQGLRNTIMHKQPPKVSAADNRTGNDSFLNADNMTDEDIKKLIKSEYEQSLREIQYKIIENLQKVTGDKRITEKYDLLCVNAKKALFGVLKNRPKLYELSKVDELDKRIRQKLQGGEALKILHAPIANLKDYFARVEQSLLTKIQDDSSENTLMKLEILRKKQDNLKEEMRILIRSETSSRLQEVTALYAGDNADAIESVMYGVIQAVDDKYVSRMTDLIAYIQRNFRDIEGLSDLAENSSNLVFDISEKDYSQNQLSVLSDFEDEKFKAETEKKGFFLFEIFKSNKKKEQEKLERLEAEAEFYNVQNERKLQEQLRRQQEARQIAASDLFEVQEKLISIVVNGINDKFDYITQYIQDAACLNESLRQEIRRQLAELGTLRGELENIENAIA